MIELDEVADSPARPVLAWAGGVVGISAGVSWLTLAVDGWPTLRWRGDLAAVAALFDRAAAGGAGQLRFDDGAQLLVGRCAYGTLTFPHPVIGQIVIESDIVKDVASWLGHVASGCPAANSPVDRVLSDGGTTRIEMFCETGTLVTRAPGRLKQLLLYAAQNPDAIACDEAHGVPAGIAGCRVELRRVGGSTFHLANYKMYDLIHTYELTTSSLAMFAMSLDDVEGDGRITGDSRAR